MGVAIYGNYGAPILAFPTSCGDEHEQEGQGMVRTLSPYIEQGRIRFFSINGVQSDSFSNKGAHPFHRSWLQAQYDDYVASEVFPFIDSQCQTPGIPITTYGASLGAYHAANTLFRHPDAFDGLIAISGLYQLRDFIGEYMDEGVYLNSPLDYLPNLEDPWYLDRLRQAKIAFVVGQGAWEEPMIEDTRAMERVLAERQIPAIVDFWGHDVNHDWPWWRQMLPHYLERLGV